MKFLFAFIFILLTGVLPLNGQVPDSSKYQSLGPYYFHLEYLKKDSSLLIDVRQPFEFKGRRIKNAINIPSSGNIERAADTLNKDFAYFLYCLTDHRSRRVAETLYDKGFRKLFNLEGGIVAWRKDGMPVEKGKIRKKRK